MRTLMAVGALLTGAFYAGTLSAQVSSPGPVSASPGAPSPIARPSAPARRAPQLPGFPRGNILHPGSPGRVTPAPRNILNPGAAPRTSTATPVPPASVVVGEQPDRRPDERPRRRGDRVVYAPVYFPVYGYYDAPSSFAVSAEMSARSSAEHVIVVGGENEPGREIDARDQEPSSSDPLEEEAEYYLIALHGGLIYAAESYTVEAGMVRFTTVQGDGYVVGIGELDRAFTEKLNRDRGVELLLP